MWGSVEGRVSTALYRYGVTGGCPNDTRCVRVYTLDLFAGGQLPLAYVPHHPPATAILPKTDVLIPHDSPEHGRRANRSFK